MTTIAIVRGDVLATRCDVLVMKYAQGFHGADQAVATALGLSEPRDGFLAVGKHAYTLTNGRLGSERVLFVGVPELGDFRYAEIRQFSRDVLDIIAGERFAKSSIAMTMHGVGYGLDEREAFSAQVAGLMEYLDSPDRLWKPDSITIVERDPARAERLSHYLDGILLLAGTPANTPEYRVGARSIPDAGIASSAKKLVFVAMPYDEDMQDVYEFGIREPVNAAGCLCERCDKAVFTGDVLERIRSRIAAATVVVADMTGANPNVYLEVGYAWGRGVPTLLVARVGQELLFDVKTHKCIYYKNISDLRKRLADLLPALVADGPSPKP
jgi:hypothetical protein